MFSCDMAAIAEERAYAFFDVDNTLIDAVSMFSFQAYWYRKTGERDAQAAFDGEIDALRQQKAPREFINRRYYAHFAGREVVRVERCAEEWFDHLERSRPDLYHDAVIAELRNHQAAGREAVLVSGSFPALLARLASRLGVRHLLATSMEIEEGRYTGRIFDPQTIGAGKATAIARFLERMRAPAAACYAYGDHLSDLPMLQAVGHPNVVRGDGALEAYAQTAGWRILAAQTVGYPRS